MEIYMGWGFNDKPEGWVLIAEQDDSEGYDVDRTAIFTTPEGFVLATASGCSCWGGEWWIENFDTLDDIEVDLIRNNDRRYKPSLVGSVSVVDEAREFIGVKKVQN